MEKALNRGMKPWTVLFLLCLQACAGSATQSTEFTSPAATPLAETPLGPGDVVEIRVFREPELGGVYRLSASGTIDFPLIGKVSLEGMNSDALASEIRSRLADGYLKNPQVSVFVKEQNSLKIHVLGQVKEEGSFPYKSGMSIIEAIALAGGFSDLASSNSVRVTRVVQDEELKIDVRVGDIRKGNVPNFELQPGDIVFVPEALF